MRSRYSHSRGQSKKFVEKRQGRTYWMILLVLIGLGLWSFSIYRFLGLPFMNIDDVQIFGAEKDVISSMRSASYEALQGTLLGFIPKSNILAYSKSDIERSIRSSSSRVETVSIKKSGLNSLIVSINEKSPDALVCLSYPDFSHDDSEKSDNCYFADRNGYLFKQAPSISGNLYNRYFAPSASGTSSDPIGSYATSTQEFVALQDFYNTTISAGMNSRAILIKENGEYELYLGDSLSDSTAVVYFNNHRPFEDQLVNLVSFWKKMNETAKSKKQILDFEYIDVRYGSNVFYRVKTE